MTLADDDAIFSMKLHGPMTAALARDVVSRTRALLRGRRVRVGVADTTGVTTMEVAIQGPVRDFVALTRVHGVDEVFCAARSPAMRMLGSALGLATGVRGHFVATEAEAWSLARGAVRQGLRGW